MRRPLTLAAIAGAALWLGWPAMHAPGARAAELGGCRTAGAPIAFAAPSGALYLVKTASGSSRIAGPGLSGPLPTGCALGELGYNPADGFLYAMHRTASAPELVRIGRASATGGLAASTVGPLGGIGDHVVADMDGSGRYTTLSVDRASQRAVIRRFTPSGRSTGRATAIRWDASCAPALGNLAAEYRLHARQARTPAPPDFVDDWAFDPADGRFYAYSAVDALDPYLGQADPASRWTVRPLPDQVVAVDPGRGTASCASVRSGAGVRSGASVSRVTRQASERFQLRERDGVDRRSRRRDDRHEMSTAADRGPLGGSAITGAAFTGPHQLTLVEGGRALWRLDVSRCFSGGCSPVRRGRSAAGLGDAAGHPYSPAQLTMRALTSADSPSPLALSSAQTGLVTLGGGQSRTVDLVPGEVTIRRAGDQSLSGIDCNGGDPAVHGGPAPDAVRLTIRQQEHVVCTFQSGPAGQAAGGGPAGGAAAAPGGSSAGAAQDSGDAARALAEPHARNPFSAFTEGSTGDRVLATAIAFALACALGGLLYVTLPRLLRVRGRG